ncbi:MAG: hypothetical protein CMJ78_16925 [Planctomycetaceae bacterium]|nr:hypothetical protein [Planctomycetaceae bacterium]
MKNLCHNTSVSVRHPRWRLALVRAVTVFVLLVLASAQNVEAQQQCHPAEVILNQRHDFDVGRMRISNRTANAQDNKFSQVPTRQSGRNPRKKEKIEGIEDIVLPPLEQELEEHGGAHLYAPEGDYFHQHLEGSVGHGAPLRVPEDFPNPQPITAFQEFLGSDPIHPNPGWKWFGENGFQWEPRFVAAGSYELFGIAFEEGNDRQDLIGHQMLLDLDFRITGTERAHVQFRPLGRRNTGGSFIQLSEPQIYDDNSTFIPDRWWIEGELYSVFSDWIDDPTKVRDYHFVAGKFPLSLHNSLLINDDITGITVSKNTFIRGELSNVNTQVFYAFDDVDAFPDVASDLFGAHMNVDIRHWFLEMTYANVTHSRSDAHDAQYAAFSATQFFGPFTFAGRGLWKWEDFGGTGDGELYVFESNLTRTFRGELSESLGLEYGVFYLNAFKSTSGWNSISGGNFDRLRAAFEVDPLVMISRSQNPADRIGVSAGVQLFRHNADESIIPEVTYEEPNDESSWGIGLRYLKKISPRTYLEFRGIRTWSDNEAIEREGVFLSTFFLL